ncbi:hypothetical protein [Hymenobacter wooponensis]|uniref:Alpha-glutamyl/putrescinyl thymine pyrophosphorylase clade 3 domain-containing protein n=1 Tax=Hymenobacter wooponensis TaxID=1525360 RepID=A0A4Z0MFH9_9BACT|nr:hypothetical protein [Hymenobacter wooponensis]TGD78229.1 hypothetical protein EU557_19140 [Hymenobacter wooponensis]
MRLKDKSLANELREKLTSFSHKPLLGIQSSEKLNCLIGQLVDSVRRVKYVTTILRRDVTDAVADPNSIAFDPIKAAVWHITHGDVNEAFWLSFLSVHFGKHKDSEWNLAKAVYGALGSSRIWTWNKVSTDLEAFLLWLAENADQIKAQGSFGNHRKYESISPRRAHGTADTIAGYIRWVGDDADHRSLVQRAITEAGDNPRELFKYLYKSMSSVPRFGRIAKFDFLSLLGKLQLMPIEPDSTYMNEATGPLRGARLLFDDDLNSTSSPNALNAVLHQLEAHLGLPFGMQVLEDAICNWQKSPAHYHHFRG